MSATDSTFTFARDLMLTFLDVEADAITPEKTFGDLGVDSLDLIEMQLELEKRFNVQFGEGLAKGHMSTKTLGELVAHVDALRAAAA